MPKKTKTKKPWWKSKTVWFNAVSMVVLTASELSQLNLVDPKILVAVIAFGNGILRFLTKEPI